MSDFSFDLRLGFQGLAGNSGLSSGWLQAWISVLKSGRAVISGLSSSLKPGLNFNVEAGILGLGSCLGLGSDFTVEVKVKVRLVLKGMVNSDSQAVISRVRLEVFGQDGILGLSYGFCFDFSVKVRFEVRLGF
ncbi:hypothetical protein M0804_014097 [Polistes exclamans]|nr:hypothetical protein M0804_014097 [Polistes exclamans]